MYDRELAQQILLQIQQALDRVQSRFQNVASLADLTDTPAGTEKLDSLCMLFIAIGEAIKNLDKITAGELLSKYPDINWRGIMGFRDIIAHHYFDVDAEQVYWICRHEVAGLRDSINQLINDLTL